jgi:hypothetical protein
LLANALPLPVTAEGIETEEHATAVRLFGCDKLQGYLFSKPVTADKFAAKYSNNRSPTLVERQPTLTWGRRTSGSWRGTHQRSGDYQSLYDSVESVNIQNGMSTFVHLLVVGFSVGCDRTERPASAPNWPLRSLQAKIQLVGFCRRACHPGSSSRVISYMFPSKALYTCMRAAGGLGTPKTPSAL